MTATNTLYFRPLFVLVLMVLFTGSTAAQDSCLATGDVNGSGDLTIGDVSTLIDIFEFGNGMLPAAYEVDINGDCVVDRKDYVALVECIIAFPFGNCPTVWTCCNPAINFCCLGDPNRSQGEPTISDISVMIDAKFVSGTCDGICIGAADFNHSGGDGPTCDDITITDVSMLIDCLFISGDISPCFEPCPTPNL